MTVAISCNLSEGVILGVDSAVTVMAPGGVLKVYENAEKLFQLGERPIGIAVFGMAGFGARSIGSYIREFEIEDPGNVVTQKTSMQDVVEQLRDFFLRVYFQTVVPSLESATGKKFDQLKVEEIPVVGFVVGGFSNNEYLSEVWQVIIPNNCDPNSATCLREKGIFGTNWFATYGPVQRYILGFDEDTISDLIGYLEGLMGRKYDEAETKEIVKILHRREYGIPYQAMPMKEGIDHVRFLVELVINHHRFSTGAPVVGGKPRIGMVTYRGEKFQIL